MISVMKNTNPMKRVALSLLRGAAVILAFFTAGSSPAFAQFSTPLTLINGWTGASQGSATIIPTVRNVSGIVQFTGAITNSINTNMQPFVMPTGFVPFTDVYIPVDLCNATKGRLHIATNGAVDIEVEGGAIGNATCFTSLDGASFALTDTGFTPLTLSNGWTNTIYNTSNAAVQNINGIVHFKGAISTFSNNTNMQPFAMPPGFAPAADVFIPVDLCRATNGRLHIAPNGAVDVEAEGGALSNATCFTSLDGASFALTDTGFTALTLSNGWTNTQYNTSNAAFQNINGTIHFKGAIQTFMNNTNMQPFVMPSGFAPGTDVYIPVDLCNTTNGRLHIAQGGAVDIEVERNTLTNATCFTSLDGVWFDVPVFNIR